METSNFVSHRYRFGFSFDDGGSLKPEEDIKATSAKSGFAISDNENVNP
jgi:hypothetical protein